MAYTPRPLQVTCTIGHTINTGNYSSLRVEWTEVWDISNEYPPSSVDMVREELRKTVQTNIKTLENKMLGSK